MKRSKDVDDIKKIEKHSATSSNSLATTDDQMLSEVCYLADYFASIRLHLSSATFLRNEMAAIFAFFSRFLKLLTF